LYYDINEVGEMHHNPVKNVLHVSISIAEIAKQLNTSPQEIENLIDSAKKKMYAARLKRPTPYVDKTVYVGWNAMAISAYLEAAKVLAIDSARHFALRSLDRILAEGWKPGLLHVLAYSDPKSERREVAGLLEDYAFTVVACLDAYETTADLSYFNFARQIADAMVERFFDPVSGGFFDAAKVDDKEARGVLGTRRKPFQDSPTPAGNPVAAIALLRLHGYTNDLSYREKAEQTLELFAGVAGQYGLFAATYGIAGVHFSQPHTQVVIVGNDQKARDLHATAVVPFALNKAVTHISREQVVPQKFPPALAETIPQLPQLKTGNSLAVICSGFSCQPPVYEPAELARALKQGNTR